MKNSERVIKLGGRGVYEQTDPDYNDKRLFKIYDDLKQVPDGFVQMFVSGIERKHVKQLLSMGALIRDKNGIYSKSNAKTT